MFNKHLRSNIVVQKKRWTDDELLAGFQNYYESYGHYPSAHEIDAYDYLPSSRSIQRSYGGLPKLRKRLLPAAEHDYTRGPKRSAKAKHMSQ